MIEILKYHYKPACILKFSGEIEDLKQLTKGGYELRKGRDNVCFAYKRTIADVQYKINGMLFNQSVLDMIREQYNVKNVTRKDLEDFVVDCNVNKKFELKFSPENGLYI